MKIARFISYIDESGFIEKLVGTSVLTIAAGSALPVANDYGKVVLRQRIRSRTGIAPESCRSWPLSRILPR